MARYIGPKARISRRFDEQIFGYQKAVDKKKYPPGQHGKSKRRKVSEYATQLAEKQKAKYIYGVLERQFSNLFKKAARKDGITGDNLLKFLEARLDNTVYRLGISKTRRGARQLVSHKHILVNGDVVNIPSYTLRPGDVVAVREKSKSLEAITHSIAGTNARRFNWLEWNGADFAGKFVMYPEREQIPEKINVQLIVELYSK